MHVKKKYIPKIEEKTNTEKNINPSRIKKKKRKQEGRNKSKYTYDY